MSAGGGQVCDRHSVTRRSIEFVPIGVPAIDRVGELHAHLVDAAKHRSRVSSDAGRRALSRAGEVLKVGVVDQTRADAGVSHGPDPGSWRHPLSGADSDPGQVPVLRNSPVAVVNPHPVTELRVVTRRRSDTSRTPADVGNTGGGSIDGRTLQTTEIDRPVMMTALHRWSAVVYDAPNLH